MQKPAFVENEVYHIYNRGVEKRSIFEDDADRFRFIHDLFEFNDQRPAANMYYHFNQQLPKTEPRNKKSPRKLIVDILAFCLMPNHYHLLLKQKTKNGIVNFMKKMGTGYAMYFNQKYQRVGPLFQGRFKAVLVNRDSHLLYLPHYIHLNPLDLFMPEWRDKKLRNHKSALKFLENYRWSSFPDYVGIKNFPSVTNREFILKLLGEKTDDYKKDIVAYLKNLNLDSIDNYLLE